MVELDEALRVTHERGPALRELAFEQAGLIAMRLVVAWQRSDIPIDVSALTRLRARPRVRDLLGLFSARYNASIRAEALAHLFSLLEVASA